MRIVKDTLFYLNEHGLLKLLKKIPVKFGRSTRFALKNITNKYFPRIIDAGNRPLAPIQIFTYPGIVPRVNLILEQGNNIKTGLDNAIILSVMTAVHLDYDLRIISNPAVSMTYFHDLLTSSGIIFGNNAEIMSYEPGKSNQEIDVCNNDIFITTSWLSTHRVTGSVNEKKVIYLLQEDERESCQADNLKLRCSEILRNEAIYFIVNSRKLYDYLLAEGFENIRNRGAWYEEEFLTNTVGGENNLHKVNDIIQNLGSFLEIDRTDVSS